MEIFLYLIPFIFFGALISKTIEYFQDRSIEKKYPKNAEDFDDSGIEWDSHSRV